MNFRSGQDVVNKFIYKGEEDSESDYLKRENSNFIYSNSLMRKNISNLYEEKYLMEHIFPQELVEKYKSGEIYVHDKVLVQS